MAYTDIDDPSAYFQTAIYTGNGGSSQAVTFNGNSDMQPDWLWLKVRSHGGNHFAYDSVRGATKALVPNDTDSEDTSYGYFSSFDSDGFTLGSADNNVNGSGRTYVGWGWIAGTSFTNDASGTGIGTIDSAGSFNNDAGFSIVSFTGTGSAGTIKHGLNSPPSMIIQKSRSSALNWKVYHKSLGATKYLNLDETGAAATASTIWNDTEPTSSVYSVGTGNTNSSSVNYIAYCFAEKQGYSKFGSYIGNGNADGTFAYTGFKPAFVMVKASSASSYDWVMLDNKRDPFHVADESLYANLSGAVQTSNNTDFIAQGFKLRSTAAGNNGSGTTYIFMAFASNPFTTSSGVPATAR